MTKNEYLKKMEKILSSGDEVHHIFKDICELADSFFLEYPFCFSVDDKVAFNENIDILSLCSLGFPEELAAEFLKINKFKIERLLGNGLDPWYSLSYIDSDKKLCCVVPERFLKFYK